MALSTRKNRIALKGGLDFAEGRFVDVTVAAVNRDGCPMVRQVIHGSFHKPVVEKPRTLATLAGPVVGLVGMARHLLPSGPCETFYSGSVPPPR